MGDINTYDPAVTDSTARAVLRKLDCIEGFLRDLLLDSEQAEDLDITYIVGGTIAAASVQVVGPMPRTIKQAEIELSLTSVGGPVAVLAGNWTLTQAQGLVNLGATAPGQANAVVISGGGKSSVRDYLDSSGYLTVFFAAAYTGFAQVRVRQLDETQARPQRT